MEKAINNLEKKDLKLLIDELESFLNEDTRRSNYICLHLVYLSYPLNHIVVESFESYEKKAKAFTEKINPSLIQSDPGCTAWWNKGYEPETIQIKKDFIKSILPELQELLKSK